MIAPFAIRLAGTSNEDVQQEIAILPLMWVKVRAFYLLETYTKVELRTIEEKHKPMNGRCSSFYTSEALYWLTMCNSVQCISSSTDGISTKSDSYDLQDCYQLV